MAKRQLRKVLYFINGVAPTSDDEAAIAEYGQGHVVCLRNATKIGNDEGLEPFDIVAGHVPPRYAEAAAEKGDEALQPVPVVPASSVPEGSPVAPPAGDNGGDGGSASSGAENGAGGASEAAPAAKPKAPAAKPGAAWKPNA